jgi:hypothetical protein
MSKNQDITYNDTWIIKGKEYSFQDRQDLYEELLKRGMIKEKPEKTIYD